MSSVLESLFFAVGEDGLSIEELESILEIDEEKNSLRSKEIRAIHKDNSKTKILVIPTNEELEIAKQVYGLLN